jgi:hypothetical protein
MGDTALQAGNSESIIRKHYLDLKSTAEADQFFGIMPKSSGDSSAASAVFPIPPDPALETLTSPSVPPAPLNGPSSLRRHALGSLGSDISSRSHPRQWSSWCASVITALLVRGQCGAQSKDILRKQWWKTC